MKTQLDETLIALSRWEIKMPPVGDGFNEALEKSFLFARLSLAPPNGGREVGD